MSDPRSTEPYRRVNLRGTVARAAATNAADTTWTTLWTWLAAIAAAVVILSLVFGLTHSDLVQNRSSQPVTTGSASHQPASPSPASVRLGDDANTRAPSNSP
jgi:anti-sigma-K factor RskA